MVSVIQTFFICVVVLVGITMVFAIVVSMLPDGNPLKAFLGSLTRTLGWTAGLTVAGIPINAIGDQIGIGELYDLAVVGIVLLMWFRFFKSQYEAYSVRGRVGEIHVVNTRTVGQKQLRE